MTLKNYGKTKKVKKDQEQKKGKEQKKSTLERKLDIPLPLSVIWYIIAISLLFYGLYILGMHFLLKHVVKEGGQWWIFTAERPVHNPFSGFQDIRWGKFYIPVKAMSKYYPFAPLAAFFGFLMLGVRSLTFSAFVKKFSKK